MVIYLVVQSAGVDSLGWDSGWLKFSFFLEKHMKRLFAVIVLAGACVLTGCPDSHGAVPTAVTPQAPGIPTAPVLIKGSLDMVYYLHTDGLRYVFPNHAQGFDNDDAYFTWYMDKSKVVTITDADLATIKIAGNCNFRAGSYFVKVASDPKVYWVGHSSVLHVVDAMNAAIIGGPNWQSDVKVIADAFFTNYAQGAEMKPGHLVEDGMLYQKVSGGDVFLVDQGASRKVRPAAMTANGLRQEFVRLRTDTEITNLASGSDLTDGSYFLAHNPTGH